jgi:hypothetical protein
MACSRASFTFTLYFKGRAGGHIRDARRNTTRTSRLPAGFRLLRNPRFSGNFGGARGFRPGMMDRFAAVLITRSAQGRSLAPGVSGETLHLVAGACPEYTTAAVVPLPGTYAAHRRHRSKTEPVEWDLLKGIFRKKIFDSFFFFFF